MVWLQKLAWSHTEKQEKQKQERTVIKIISMGRFLYVPVLSLLLSFLEEWKKSEADKY